MGFFSNGKVDRLVDKVKELKVALEQSRDELSEMKAEARSAKDEARQAKAELKQIRDTQREAIRREQDKVKSTKDSKQHLETRTNELSSELNDLKSKSDQTRSKLAESEDEVLALRGAQEQIIAKNQEIQEFSTKLKDAELALEREPDEIELHNQVNLLTETKTRLTQKSNQLKARVKKLESERQDARRESALKAALNERTIRELRYRIELDGKAYAIQQLELESRLAEPKVQNNALRLKLKKPLKLLRKMRFNLLMLNLEQN